MVVAVTGGSGQLGQALKRVAAQYPQVIFHFATSSEADIADAPGVEQFFARTKPQYCINAAAYTAVDKAESEPEKAYRVNSEGAANVARACQKHGVVLLHISTDFVFDGTKGSPYTEEDQPMPQSVYGSSKLQGEQEIQRLLPQHYIIRTSWVYSQFGNNFMKTMLRLAAEKPALNVVCDQIGTPTHALDLADALLRIISSGKSAYGIYNYSNEGQCSWYEFALAIFRTNNLAITVNPISTTSYPTPAKRPAYSVLDKHKIKLVFGLQIPDWEDALSQVR